MGSVAAVLLSAIGGASLEAASDAAKRDSAPSTAFAVGYTGDSWHNLDGGIERGGAFLSQIDLTLDWESAASGLRAHTHVFYNHGKSFSEKVGDTHVVSNIEADRATRVLQAWVEYAPSDPDRSLKVGLYDLNTEFDASEVGGALINSTFGIGIDAAQSGVSGPSIFPYTGLALRGRWRFNDEWMLQGVVIDGVPVDPAHPRRAASLRLNSDEGSLFVAEVERRRGEWRSVLGHWRYSAKFDTFDSFVSGTADGSRNNAGTYAFVEGPIAEIGGRRLLAMLRVGAARPQFNTIGSTVQAAFMLERPWLGKDGEHLALGIAMARNGTPARRLGEAIGEPLLARETVLELSWRAPLTERLTVQPDIHYIVNPGSTPGRDDALIVGVRIELDLTPN